MGNAPVADVIAKVTQWIGRVCEAHHGRTVKFLGDGVLAQFQRGDDAVEAAVFMQQNHSERLEKWPQPLRMGLKIGMARGGVVQMADDVYGDPVNLAARLSDMAGTQTIWADESVIAELRHRRDAHSHDQPHAGGERVAAETARYRSLGMMRVRGLSEPHSVFQIEWSEEVSTDLMTVRGALHDLEIESGMVGGSIALAWLGKSRVFAADDLPIVIGRIPDSSFVVSDQRVSRHHARIEVINGAFVLSDLSSFGTWVRFTENPASEVQLRRNQCVLHSTGEIALGASFSDFSAAVVAFSVGAAGPGAESRLSTRELFGDSQRA
ncbi:FHA domain-containing protein [Ottowia testudinis]|uniref:FHA domain-containing protein n=1 Tax=Ottowia testudinis TaxID=2816950 RepID=UPI003D66178F